MERCESGLIGRPGKSVCQKWHRGFESLSLRRGLCYNNFMDTLVHADVFFFITTIAVIAITSFLVVALFYIVEILKNFRDISATLKQGVKGASDGVENLIKMIQDIPILKAIFGTQKKTRKSRTKEK